jgi:hypothetical protein
LRTSFPLVPILVRVLFFRSLLWTDPHPSAPSAWDRVFDEIIENIEWNKSLRFQEELRKERLQRQETAQAALPPYYNRCKAAFLDGEIDGDFPNFESFVSLDAVKPFWEPDDSATLDDASWATVSDNVLQQALELIRSFQLTLATRLVSAFEGTAYAIDPVLVSKILPSPNANDSFTVSISNAELASLFAPYKHLLFCGGCQSIYWRSSLHSGSALFAHASFLQHGLSEMERTMYVQGWAETVADAFELVGITEGDETPTSPAALEAIGSRWICQDCPRFLSELKSDDEACKMLQIPTSAGLEWKRMVRLLSLLFPSIADLFFPWGRTHRRQASQPLRSYSADARARRRSSRDVGGQDW